MGYLDYNKVIGANIKRVRIEKRMSQCDLGAACNMEDSAISRIEAGRTNPTIKTIYEISIALKVDINELLNEHGDIQF